MVSLMLLEPARIGLMEDLIVRFLFPMSYFGFLFVGLYTLLDITLAMKRDYEQKKQELTEEEEFRGLFVK